MPRARTTAVDTSDRPFALPNRELITTVIDVPVPPSVNSTRRVNWRSHVKVSAWHKSADNMMMFVPKAQRRPVPGKFELLITMSEQHCRLDLDNGLKCLIDYLRRIELITNDSPKYLRRLVVEWCHPAVAPQGVRVTIQELAL
jgi:Holliday junction resolvase RusA-like endonuclease